MSSELDILIKNFESLKYNVESNKIICEWTGHEIPAKTDAVLNYVNGRRYKTFLEKKINTTDLKKYAEFLVPSNYQNRQNQLFCKLTLNHLNRQPDHIQKHLNGKKFQKAYQHWLHCQETNQTFVPFSRRSQKKQSEQNNEDDIDGDDEEDMSDLLPEMFDLIGSDIDDNDQSDSKHNDIIDTHKNGDIEDSFEEIDEDLMELDEEVKDNNKSNSKRKIDSKLNKKQKIEPKKKKAK